MNCGQAQPTKILGFDISARELKYWGLAQKFPEEKTFNARRDLERHLCIGEAEVSGRCVGPGHYSWRQFASRYEQGIGVSCRGSELCLTGPREPTVEHNQERATDTF